MRRLRLHTCVLVSSALALTLSSSAATGQGSAQQIDLAERLAAGTLRAVNRDVSPVKEGRRGVHLSEKEGNGVAWIEGTDFGEGTIEADIRGRDLAQRSFVGVAFHRKDDTTYEAVYLRPFNFRNADVARRQNAVQYIALPEYDWPRLRKEFPSEFENPVDASIVPTDWVPLRIVVKAKTIEVYAGAATAPALEVRRLGAHDRGSIGLWVGNGSDGDFANVRITPMK